MTLGRPRPYKLLVCRPKIKFGSQRQAHPSHTGPHEGPSSPVLYNIDIRVDTQADEYCTNCKERLADTYYDWS